MKKALIVVDYTEDFVATDGKLTCGAPGQAIEETIVRLIEGFIAADDVVIFANDIHEADDSYHPESKLFPAHNIRGTKGCELYGDVKKTYEKYKHNDHVLAIDKTRYSAFAGTNLHILLSERRIEEIHLVGVCTDICILHTAIDAYNLAIPTVIHAKGVASFNEAGHEFALSHFKNILGASIFK